MYNGQRCYISFQNKCQQLETIIYSYKLFITSIIINFLLIIDDNMRGSKFWIILFYSLTKPKKGIMFPLTLKFTFAININLYSNYNFDYNVCKFQNYVV